MSAKNKNLGKGLDLLFGEGGGAEHSGPSSLLDINLIEPNRDQPRKNFEEGALEALSRSIAAHGVITPLAVRKLGDGRYQIIAGERRFRAARRAGLKELPVIILEADDVKALELAMIENLQREDLDPLEEAEGYRVLSGTYGMTQEAVAERVGKSRSAVANSMRLLELADAVRPLLRSGRLTPGHAKALLSIRDEKRQEKAANYIVDRGLTVRQAEVFVKSFLKDPKPEPPAAVKVDYQKVLSDELTELLGRGVSVVPSRGKKGRVVLEYYDLDDLDGLLALIRGMK